MRWTFQLFGIFFALVGFVDAVIRLLIEAEVPLEYERNEGALGLFGWIAASAVSLYLATRAPVLKANWAKVTLVAAYVGLIAVSMAILTYIDCAGGRCGSS